MNNSKIIENNNNELVFLIELSVDKKDQIVYKIDAKGSVIWTNNLGARFIVFSDLKFDFNNNQYLLVGGRDYINTDFKSEPVRGISDGYLLGSSNSPKSFEKLENSFGDIDAWILKATISEK